MNLGTNNKIKQKLLTFKDLLEAVDEASQMMDSFISGERNIKAMLAEQDELTPKLDDLRNKVKNKEEELKAVIESISRAEQDSLDKIKTDNEAAIIKHRENLDKETLRYKDEIEALKTQASKLTAVVEEKQSLVKKLTDDEATISAKIGKLSKQLGALVAKITGE